MVKELLQASLYVSYRGDSSHKMANTSELQEAILINTVWPLLQRTLFSKGLKYGRKHVANLQSLKNDGERRGGGCKYILNSELY